MTEKKEFPMADKSQSGCGCGCIGATQKDTETLKPETDKPKK
jgi:hypothetical protein